MVAAARGRRRGRWWSKRRMVKGSGLGEWRKRSSRSPRVIVVTPIVIIEDCSSFFRKASDRTQHECVRKKSQMLANNPFPLSKHVAIPTFFLKTRGMSATQAVAGYQACFVHTVLFHTHTLVHTCIYMTHLTANDTLRQTFSLSVESESKSLRVNRKIPNKFISQIHVATEWEKTCVGVKIKPPLPDCNLCLVAICAWSWILQAIQPCHACTSTAH